MKLTAFQRKLFEKELSSPQKAEKTLQKAATNPSNVPVLSKRMSAQVIPPSPGSKLQAAPSSYTRKMNIKSGDVLDAAKVAAQPNTTRHKDVAAIEPKKVALRIAAPTLADEQISLAEQHGGAKTQRSAAVPLHTKLKAAVPKQEHASRQ